MQLHQLKPKNRPQGKKRVGRGGKRGTTSGRGTKGQKARAGHKIRPALRDIIKKLPKRRGYKFRSFALLPAVLNLDDIARRFSSGDKVTPQTLIAKGLISRVGGKIPRVKILGGGDLGQKKLHFDGVEFSREAKRKSV